MGALLWSACLSNVKCFHPSINDITGASSSAQHTSTTPENHPLVLGGAPPVTAGGSQTSATLTVVSSPSGSSSTGGQQLDSTPHSVETPNQLLNAHHTDNISEAGATNSYGPEMSFYGHQRVQHPLDPPQTTSDEISMTEDRKNSLSKKRGIFPKPATNIMRAWLFHHLKYSFGWSNELDMSTEQVPDLQVMSRFQWVRSTMTVVGNQCSAMVIAVQTTAKEKYPKCFPKRQSPNSGHGFSKTSRYV
ncbi:unnamed protein product [Dracunculus medinensis]|uniref:Homeobox_KN domain-containing protein n=1 Tax=Dracunculus medinensis TaxID=318479 RepID=A0A0N4UL33_DRAME|nr:unnamed protein product [Dracunculus medinensis]